MVKVIVIGGGIIGCSTAFRLAQAGAQVTLLEARELASGTSSTSFAWMNSNNKAPVEYHRLNVAGMAEHSRLREEFGSAPWLHVDGNVIWNSPSRGDASNEPAVPVSRELFNKKIQRLREWGYPVEMLTPAELAAIHPDVRPEQSVERVAYFPTEGHVDVPHLVARLATAARERGAEILINQDVVEIMQDSGRVVGVRTATGDTHLADVVVSCTGRWTDQVADLTGHQIPLAPTLGLLVVSKPVATTLRSLVHTTSVNLRPDGGSRVIMASFEHDALLEWEMPQETVRGYAEEILARATEILPALTGSAIESFKVGIRALTQDGLPAIGPVSGLEGFYVVVTHSGVTMGPFIGQIVAREILTGEMDERIANFRPDRFLVGAATSV